MKSSDFLNSKNIRHLARKVRKYLPAFAIFVKGMSLLYSKRSYLKETGYLKSVAAQKPCKKDGSPIPWMNYNVISFLEERLRKDHSLFEYGCGNSTLFFSKYAGNVVSVECNRQWYEYVNESKPGNVILILHDPFDSEAYSKIIDNQNKKFDVIVIDAEDRAKCLINAPQCLSERGVIILDDSQGDSFSDAAAVLLNRGFKQLDFIGLKPASPRGVQTTIFYRNDNCLGI
jgi:hypothetical protein